MARGERVEVFSLETARAEGIEKEFMHAWAEMDKRFKRESLLEFGEEIAAAEDPEKCILAFVKKGGKWVRP